MVEGFRDRLESGPVGARASQAPAEPSEPEDPDCLGSRRPGLLVTAGMLWCLGRLRVAPAAPGGYAGQQLFLRGGEWIVEASVEMAGKLAPGRQSASRPMRQVAVCSPRLRPPLRCRAGRGRHRHGCWVVPG